MQFAYSTSADTLVIISIRGSLYPYLKTHTLSPPLISLRMTGSIVAGESFHLVTTSLSKEDRNIYFLE